MDTKQFLGAVLGGEGYYCVAGKKNEGSMKQQFHDSLDAVTEAANNFDGQGHDVYFALSSFADKNRKSDNARDLKSLFLDIDCGTDKPYQTQSDALKALRTFRKTYTLPKPFIVNSGRGLHVYWTLDRSYSREEWKPVASQLKATCLQDGLDIDPVVTDDAARLLRIPNTRNFKGEQPLPVVVVLEGDLEVELAAFAGKLPAELIPVPSINSSSQEDLEDMERAKGLSKYRYNFKNIITSTRSGTGCAHIERAILKPDELTYPEWLHTLSIAKRCDTDGVEEGTTPAVHLISKRATNYDPEETRKISESIEYPHTCVKFDEDYPGLCKDCAHKGKIKSPIALCSEIKIAQDNTETIQVPVVPEDPEEKEAGVVVESPTLRVKTTKVTVPDYPKPYERPNGGGVVHVTSDAEGNREEASVLDNTLYVSKRMIEDGKGPSYEIRHLSPHEGERSFLATQTDLTSVESFRNVMNKNDVLIGSEEVKKAMSYVKAWMKKLINAGPATYVKPQFGWTEHCKSFVLGDKEIFADTVKDNPAGTRTAQYIPMFQQKGSLDEWKELAKFYGQKGFEQHQYMFGLSFGSPLMEFVSGISGAIYNLTSTETGIGKTTGMWGGASVWGDHKQIVLIGKDTDNSAWNRAEIMKNLPLYIDEISNFKAEQASNFCYSISDGMQKNRMSNEGQNAERFRAEVWALSCGTTGNSSLTQVASTFRENPKGEAGRVVSVTAKKLLKGDEDTLRANELNDKLAANYGWAGPIFIQYVIKNKAEVEQEVKDIRTKMIKELKSEAQDRFWVAQGVTTYVGCKIAKKIGLIDWDLDNLWRWIIHTILAQKHDLQEMDMDINDVVAQFYMDNVRSILRISSTTDGRDPVILATLEPQDIPTHKFIGRHETDINKFYIRVGPFKKWCSDHKYDWSTIKSLMVVHMNAKNVKKNMGKGTKAAIGMTHVLECTFAIDSIPNLEGSDEAKSE